MNSISLKVLCMLLLLSFSSFQYGQDEFIDAMQAEIIKEEKKLNFYGDFRFRPEYDWNSNNATSSSNDGIGKRKDRFRLRYRMRFGFVYDWNTDIKIGMRLRTGVPSSIQSPHVNFGYKGLGMVPFNLDKIFFRYDRGVYWGWVGKNSFPFWTQNELFWDDDVTPEGLVFGMKYKVSAAELSPTIAYFMANNIPVEGNTSFPFNGSGEGLGNGDNYGAILGAQLKLLLKSINYQGIASVGYYGMNDIFTSTELSKDATGSTDPYLALDYKFLMASLQYKSFFISEKWPIILGYDIVNNLEDYTGDEYTDVFNALGFRDELKDEKTSHTASLAIGRSKIKGDWLFAYHYAHKEMFSVVSYFTEDDWVRWGNIHANRNTNFKGHEIRFVYTIAENFNIIARYYAVEALERRSSSDDQLESGNRFRVDFNIKF